MQIDLQIPIEIIERYKADLLLRGTHVSNEELTQAIFYSLAYRISTLEDAVRNLNNNINRIVESRNL
ncbi:hypothetical protein F0919_17405 [Taibaiella lutea]|uniref:Uncharacterized protein n=1 Tax=Taibaiella lutea TaxID=2608001 RepID=A0A5M6CHD2_9BACT|nr:hypothetical protein [Taibaiella lutea]KAA5532559.1 hypothetical protein F0919_17405 [Taibaiella lutea]